MSLRYKQSKVNKALAAARARRLINLIFAENHAKVQK